MKRFGKKFFMLFLALFLLFTNSSESMMFAATDQTETPQEEVHKENHKVNTSVKGQARTSEWVPFGDAWIDVSEDADGWQMLQEQNGGVANNSYLEALDNMTEDNKIIMKTTHDLSFVASNGTIYGSKEHPIREVYQSYFASNWVINFLWGGQQPYKLDSYVFLNKIPKTLKFPVPFYIEIGEKNPDGYDFFEGFKKDGYSNTVVEIQPQNLMNSEEKLQSGFAFKSSSFQYFPRVRYFFIEPDGYSNSGSSMNGWAAHFTTNMSVNYTVDIAPLNEGGSPKLSGGTPTTSPKATVKGVNSEHFRKGELNPDESAYQLGLAQDGETISDAIIATYGDTYKAQLNPDTENGYIVDYYILTTFDPITGEKLKEEKVSPTDETLTMDLKGKTEIRVAYKQKPEIQEPTIHKSSLTSENVKQGDTITYALDLENKNSDPFEVTVTDQLPEKLEAISYEVKDGNGNLVKEGKGWPQSLALTIPEAVEKQDDNISGKLRVLIKAKVMKGYSQDDSKNNIISNQATLSYDDKKQYSEVVTHYIEPKIAYHMEKVRITEAPRYEVMEGKYGFHVGNQVTYEIRISNDGETPLTMNVSDTFKEKDRFTDVKIKDITNDGGRIDENLQDAQARITVQPQKTAIVTFTAKVGKQADACLGDAAKDDGKGYANIGTVKDLETSYQKIIEVVYVENDGIKTNEIKDYVSKNVKVTKDTAGFEEILKEQTDTAYTSVQPSLWGSNTTDQHKGGSVEAVDAKGNTIAGSKSNVETGDHDAGRLASNIISVVPDAYWNVAEDKLVLEVPYLNDEEKASVQQTNNVTNGEGTLKYHYKNRYGNLIDITAKVTTDKATGKVRIEITDTNITDKDGKIETIKGMGCSVDVSVEFVPTIWIENKTEDHAGGSVQVKDKSEWSKVNSGDHETGRAVGTTVNVKPDTGWVVDFQAIQIQIPGSKGGTNKVDVDEKGNGTIIYTFAEGKEKVIAKITTNKDRSVAISIEDMKTAIDVNIAFAKKTPGISINKHADKTEVKPRESIFYMIEVKNTGDYDLVNVVVDDKALLPEHLKGIFTEVHYTDGTKEEIKDGSNVFAIGNLKQGECVTLTFKVMIPEDFEQDVEVYNTAGVESSYIPVGGIDEESLERKTASAEVVVVKVPKEEENEVNELQVKKVWNDANDSAGKRPKEIVVTLYEDDKTIEERVLNEENGWSTIFSTKKGHKYSVKENKVSMYTASYDNKDGVIVITNTYDGNAIVEPEKPKDPDKPVKPVEPEKPIGPEIPIEPEKPNINTNDTEKEPAKPNQKPTEETSEKHENKPEIVKTGEAMVVFHYMFLMLMTGLLCVGMILKRNVNRAK